MQSVRDATTIANEIIASGLSPAQTALLMELVLSMSTGLSTGQVGESRAILNRRAWDRDRKQRERDAKRASATSTGIHRTSTGLPPENADVCPTVVVKKEGLSVGKERKKGSRLLVGTRVNDEQRAVAIEWGCPPDKVDAVWSEFVDYWSEIPGQHGVKMTWLGTWRNRVKQIFGKSNGRGTSDTRANTAAGRATARETEHVTSMGRGALRVLQEGKSAGQGGDLPGSAGSAEVIDIGKRAENAR